MKRVFDLLLALAAAVVLAVPVLLVALPRPAKCGIVLGVSSLRGATRRGSP